MISVFQTMASGVRHRGIQVFLILTAYLVAAKHLSPEIHQGFYTLSCLIKDLLVWMLPVTICFFIAHTISSFQKKALLFVVAIIVFEAASNLCSVWYAYLSGHIAAGCLPPLQIPPTGQEFQPLWHFPFVKPSWWSSDKGSVAGIAVGALAAIYKNSFCSMIVEKGKTAAQYVLTRFFSPLIPLFVLGFVAKMYQTQLLYHVMTHCSILVIWLTFFLSLYIALLFFIGSDYSIKDFARNARNVLPAGGIAFTSGCSLSTMPWTISGTAKNLRTPQLAEAVIPATTNIQQVGDCISNSFLCFLIYNHFYGAPPDCMTWFYFSCVFVLARFATAAVLGGAIFIMLPIYETYLSFNTEMIAIILAFNVILDPLITATNVLGNGALCRVFEKVWDFILLKKTLLLRIDR